MKTIALTQIQLEVTMPANIRIIHAHEFIKATPDGELDLKESKKVLMGIASASVPLDQYDIILDTRHAHSSMTETDLWHLSAELAKHHGTFARKTAVIGPIERFDYAGFFALCAQNRGFQVRAFVSYGEAMDWLLGN